MESLLMAVHRTFSLVQTTNSLNLSEHMLENL